MIDNSKDIKAAREVLEKGIEGLSVLNNIFDEKFISAIDLIFNLKGRVVVSGMGKSGHIARKIAATFSSTGTPALFIHPAEASHGDLGMITSDDAVILLSNSGETSELKDIIEYTRRFSIPLIGIVRRKSSILVDASDIAFILPEIPEASPVDAPTTSTTMMLVWGDALAMATLDRRGFKKDDFNIYHPGGKLGSQFIKIEQLMKKGDELPIVNENDLMSDALIIMTSKSLGCAAVIDKNNKTVGVITDGDLRRHMSNDLTSLNVCNVMKKNPITMKANALAVEAIAVMNDKNITSILINDDDGLLVGIVHIHSLLSAGVS